MQHSQTHSPTSSLRLPERDAPPRQWYLEGYFGASPSLERVRLEPLPFTVGRTTEAGLTLDSPGISRHHARFFEREGQLHLEDTGSTNGTYLNQSRLEGTTAVGHDDIVHFAEVECRVLGVDTAEAVSDPERTRAVTPLLSSTLARGSHELQELLEERRVTAHFQPIVHSDGRPFAWELLGRGTHPGLPTAPRELFAIAEGLGLEVQLSELMRDQGLRLAADNGIEVPCFFNIHPAEMRDPERLVRSLEGFRASSPRLPAVLEVHERAVAGLEQLRELRLGLDDLDVGLAYDDFGTGQTRLLEVAEVPPDYVKFDMALITGIHAAGKAQRTMVEMLVRFSRDSGIRTCAEGIEQPGEAMACAQLGFDLLQGYYFGEPGPLEPDATV